MIRKLSASELLCIRTAQTRWSESKRMDGSEKTALRPITLAPVPPPRSVETRQDEARGKVVRLRP